MDIKRQERAPIYEALEEFKKKRVDQIADVAETDVDEVEAIIKKKEPAMA